MRLLGIPAFQRDGSPVEVAAGKSVALLAYLALSSGLQPRDRLLGLLWGDSFEDAARKNLRNSLWSLRKALGEGIVRSEGDMLALGGEPWIDARELDRIAGGDGPLDQHAQSAILDLYRGPLLEGLVLNDAPEFEAWMSGERERLEQAFLRLLARMIDEHRSRGDWPEVAELARRGVSLDSLQEPMHRVLIEAYARMGRRSEAIRHYDLLKATLDRELGVAPLPETEALRESIIRGELLPPSPVAASRPATRLESSAKTPRGVFVGRREECSVLDEELAIAARGRPRAVLLTGEVGIGKTRLWKEWSSNLGTGVTVLEARSLASTQLLPFAPLSVMFGDRKCLRRLTTSPSPISPVWLAEVARLLPEVRGTLPDLPDPASLPVEEERRRLFEALVQLLAALDGGPLVLFFDDLHWADSATLDWLDYLMHRHSGTPLLLVAAYRPEDAPSGLVQLLARWTREGIVRRLPLGRLPEVEVEELLAALGVDSTRAARVAAQAAGNPYFLLELSRATTEEVPPSLAELIRARVELLPETARQVLQAAAILEPSFDFAMLRRTSGRGEEETLDALDALVDASILSEEGGKYGFSHPLVASVVRSDLGAARRAFLNLRAARSEEAAYASRLPVVAGRLASHYAETGDTLRAAAYAEMAAKRAMELSAPVEAVAFYRRSLELDPNPSRQLGLGEALYRLGDLAGARDILEEAYRGFQELGDDQGIARASLEMAGTYLPSGRAHEGVRWIEKALSHVDPEVDPRSYAQAHFLLGASQLQSGGPLGEAEGHLLEAARLAEEKDLTLLSARTRFELGNLLAQKGDLPGAVHSFRESISLSEAAGDQLQTVLGHNNAAYHSLLAGDLKAARRHATAGLELARRWELDLPLQYLYSTLGEVSMAEGQWEEADGLFQQGIVKAEANGNAAQAANYRANLGLAARSQGRLDEALSHLSAARESADKLVSPRLQSQIDLWLADLHMDRGEWVAADEALSRAEARTRRHDQPRLLQEATRLREKLEVARKG